jgi:hypothetical protein
MMHEFHRLVASDSATALLSQATEEQERTVFSRLAIPVVCFRFHEELENEWPDL